MVGGRVPPRGRMCEVSSYLAAVKEVLDDEVEKYNEFRKIFQDVRAHRVSETNGIPRIAELIQGNRRLLLGLSFLYPEVKLTIPPEADQLLDVPDYTQKKRAAHNFMKKLETRFKTVDAHVVESFRGLMKMFKEGSLPAKKVYDEVIDLIYYHEDLREDFSRFFPLKLPNQVHDSSTTVKESV